VEWHSKEGYGVMRSFRLDPDSIAAFLDSWPALVIGFLLLCLSTYLGIAHLWGPVCAVVLCGTYGGFLLRGIATQRLREQYPGARWVWLLSVGFTTLMVGVATRMAFPLTQAWPFDLAWLGVSFFSILAFVLANRKDKNVVR
jgi:hypothetical protein